MASSSWAAILGSAAMRWSSSGEGAPSVPAAATAIGARRGAVVVVVVVGRLRGPAVRAVVEWARARMVVHGCGSCGQTGGTRAFY